MSREFIPSKPPFTMDGRSCTPVQATGTGEMHFANHQHLDSGQFQLYYRGPLAIDSGLYEGKQAYGSPHFRHYFQRTIAHNCLLVLDPDEVFAGDPELANDGGQRWPNFRKEAKTLEELLEKDYRKAEVSGHWIGPDTNHPAFSYLKGDLTGAYSGKVKKVERAFVFLHLDNPGCPGAMVVWDRVIASNPDFRKYWLLHTLEEPRIEGNKTMVSLSERAYTGQLTMETIGPSEAHIEKVGGNGKEFDVFGPTFPNEELPEGDWKGGYESGRWRIQVSPTATSASDVFLHVLSVHDSEGQASCFEKVEADGMIGVQGEGRVVLFSSSGEPVGGQVCIPLPDNGKPVQILLTDLASGEWKLAETGEVFTVLKGSGVLYFSAAGKYVTLAPR